MHGSYMHVISVGHGLLRYMWACGLVGLWACGLVGLWDSFNPPLPAVRQRGIWDNKFMQMAYIYLLHIQRKCIYACKSRAWSVEVHEGLWDPFNPPLPTVRQRGIGDSK